MWDNIIGRVPTGMIFACTILAFVIPYIFYKINNTLHKYGDPPWKREKK